MAEQNNHDPAGESRAKSSPDKSNDAVEASNPDSSVISVTTFKSRKGNVYRITRTNEVDDYECPPSRPGE